MKIVENKSLLLGIREVAGCEPWRNDYATQLQRRYASEWRMKFIEWRWYRSFRPFVSDLSFVTLWIVHLWKLFKGIQRCEPIKWNKNFDWVASTSISKMSWKCWIPGEAPFLRRKSQPYAKKTISLLPNLWLSWWMGIAFISIKKRRSSRDKYDIEFGASGAGKYLGPGIQIVRWSGSIVAELVELFHPNLYLSRSIGLWGWIRWFSHLTVCKPSIIRNVRSRRKLILKSGKNMKLIIPWCWSQNQMWRFLGK